MPQTSIPAPFTGDWSTNSIGLITYWDQGSYVGSDGDIIFTVSLNSNGTAAFYGYYSGVYSGTTFYRYACTAAYKEENDGSVTITVYPYGGEQMIGSGPKRPIGSNSLYPNKVFVLKNCTVYTENGKTYFSYYELDNDGKCLLSRRFWKNYNWQDRANVVNRTKLEQVYLPARHCRYNVLYWHDFIL